VNKFAAAWATGDAKKVAALYHPNAAFVHVGRCSYYGKEAIEKVFEKFLATPSDFTIKIEINLEAGDGQYLIQRGSFSNKDDNGKQQDCPYEQIFKRQSDGSYLIYHDEFSI